MRPAVAYFAIVFGIGFAFGTVRTLYVVPRLGARTAELLEVPLMLAAIYIAARWLLRRFPVAREPKGALRIGVGALAFLLTAEVTLGLVLRGGSVVEVLFDRDIASGTAYYAALCAFGLLPWFLATRERQGIRARERG
jgi:hypothetical protein